jgi:hypothetical protein
MTLALTLLDEEFRDPIDEEDPFLNRKTNKIHKLITVEMEMKDNRTMIGKGVEESLKTLEDKYCMNRVMNEVD